MSVPVLTWKFTWYSPQSLQSDSCFRGQVANSCIGASQRRIIALRPLSSADSRMGINDLWYPRLECLNETADQNDGPDAWFEAFNLMGESFWAERTRTVQRD